MSGERPPRRLVGGQEYTQIMGKRFVLHSEAITGAGMGLACLLGSACFISIGVYNGKHPYLGPLGHWIYLCGLFAGGLGIAALWYSQTLFKEVKQIEPVALITRHNTDQLPERETLVRGADIPATDPPSELLRAIRQEPQTPPEQLLRATRENRHDV